MNHAIRIYADTELDEDVDEHPAPEVPDHAENLPEAVPDRVKGHILNHFNPILEDQNIEARETETEDGEKYIQGLYRLNDTDEVDDIVDRIIDRVVYDCEWYRLEYHNCDHDEDQPAGCSGWIRVADKGEVPDYI